MLIEALKWNKSNAAYLSCPLAFAYYAMEWIPALLKHLVIARSAIGALFITSVVLYVGPRISPTYIDPAKFGVSSNTPTNTVALQN